MHKQLKANCNKLIVFAMIMVHISLFFSLFPYVSLTSFTVLYQINKKRITEMGYHKIIIIILMNIIGIDKTDGVCGAHYQTPLLLERSLIVGVL